MKKNLGKVWNLLIKAPVVSFVVFLVLLFVFIAIGNQIRSTGLTEDETGENIRLVNVFAQQNSYLPVQARVEQNGIVRIVALQGGIVNRIEVSEGDHVRQGQRLMNLASNFQGANAANLQSRRAYLAYQNTLANYDTSREMLEIRRNQVDLQRDNDEQLSEIRRYSLDDTNRILNILNDQLQGVEDQIRLLENNGGANQAVIAELRTAQVAILGQTTNLRATARGADYELNQDGAAWQLRNSSYELTLRQLEMEERGLALSRQMSALDLQLARINESLMHPVSPFAGRVEHIHVRMGDLVSPGTVLITVAASNRSSQITARVDERLVGSIDPTRQALISLDGILMPLDVSHLSSVPTVGSTYNVTLALDSLASLQVSNNTHVEVRLPLINYRDSRILLPIDSVFQTSVSDYVFIVDVDENGDQVATLQEVALGSIIGNMVEVLFGLTADSLVITDRGVMAGERVALRN